MGRLQLVAQYTLGHFVAFSFGLSDFHDPHAMLDESLALLQVNPGHRRKVGSIAFGVNLSTSAASLANLAANVGNRSHPLSMIESGAVSSAAAAAAAKQRLLAASMMDGSWTHVAAWNAGVGGQETLGGFLKAQLEYELYPPLASTGRSKLGLAIIEMLGLGLFGVDRCYMGQALLGTVKGLTFGGFAVWALVDYVAVMTGLLVHPPSVEYVGFTPLSAVEVSNASFWVTLLGFNGAVFLLLATRTRTPTNKPCVLASSVRL